MPDLSDERTWWSSLFPAGEDPGLDLRDEVWDTAMGATFDADTPVPQEDLLPAEYGEAAADDWGENTVVDHDISHLLHIDGAVDHGHANDVDAQHVVLAEDTHDDSSDSGMPHSTAPDDAVFDESCEDGSFEDL